jgi:hypothetical protein
MLGKYGAAAAVTIDGTSVVTVAMARRNAVPRRRYHSIARRVHVVDGCRMLCCGRPRGCRTRAISVRARFLNKIE